MTLERKHVDSKEIFSKVASRKLNRLMNIKQIKALNLNGDSIK